MGRMKRKQTGKECGERPGRVNRARPRFTGSWGSGVRPRRYPTVSRRGPSNKTDRGLTDHLADVGAFEALYASHGPRMKSLALNMLGNRSDAEDAVQEAFLRA